MSLARRIGGSRAVRVGRAFEDRFETVCRLRGVACEAIPDGCRVVGRGRLLRVHTPFDFVLSGGGKVAFVDTKTYIGNRIAPSDIKDHQFEALKKQWDAGHVAGYVILFRASDLVCFLTVPEMAEMRRKGKGKADQDLFNLGTSAMFKIEQALTLRTLGTSPAPAALADRT